MTTPNCPFRGRVIQWSKTGDHPDVYSCVGGPKVCTLEPSDLRTKEGPIQDCEHCSKRPVDGKSARATVGPCIHRKEPTRLDESNLCGTRGDIIQLYGCEKHEECSLFHYCQDQTAKVCLTCNERQPPTEADETSTET